MGSVLNFKTLERIAMKSKTDSTVDTFFVNAVEEWARNEYEQEEEIKKTMSPTQYKE